MENHDATVQSNTTAMDTSLQQVAAESEAPVSSSNSIPKRVSVSGNDDLDVMLMHEDFPKLFELGTQIQQGQKEILAQTGKVYTSQQNLPKCYIPPDDTIRCLHNLKRMLRSHPEVTGTVPRGQYPISDAVLDDAFKVLRQEHLDIQRTLHPELYPVEPPPPPKKRGRKRKKKDPAAAAAPDSIAIKYPKWKTDILFQWMMEHIDEPFPDQQAIEDLMRRTGLSHSQIVNWTTNVRKRNRKATLEGKKPHHFIDFMFLVQDRERKKQQDSTTPVLMYEEEPSTLVVSPNNHFPSPPSSPIPMVGPPNVVTPPSQFFSHNYHPGAQQLPTGHDHAHDEDEDIMMLEPLPVDLSQPVQPTLMHNEESMPYLEEFAEEFGQGWFDEADTVVSISGMVLEDCPKRLRQSSASSYDKAEQILMGRDDEMGLWLQRVGGMH